MSKRFKEMNCYILAGGETNPVTDFQSQGDLPKLEHSYRTYAKVFDRVKLVIKKEQARERYLNYPHVCDDHSAPRPLAGVAAALKDAQTEAIFIGSSEIGEFPPALLVDLVKKYQGEPFLGYVDTAENRQHWFGIYNKQLVSELEVGGDDQAVLDILIKKGRFIPLPDDIDAECIGL